MSTVCALLAATTWCWPRPVAVLRLRAARTVTVARGDGLARLRRARTTVPAWTPTLVAAALGALLAGVGGAAAAVLGGVTAARVRRAARAERDRAAAAGGLADALASFAAEVRAGAPSAVAAESAAADAHPVAARALTRIAATARLGGDVPAALRTLAGAGDLPGDEHLERLAAAWALAERHGVGLALPVGAVATDLRARARLAGRVDAQLAGPRATAGVLAALPVLGVLLGEGIGARPWSVLASTALGQGLLVAGVGLVCAGVLWTARITSRASR